MASCSYSALFESVSRCGARSKNPQNIQCVVISECTKEVYPHVKSLKIGPDEAIRDESTLLLARAGIFFICFMLYRMVYPWPYVHYFSCVLLLCLFTLLDFHFIIYLHCLITFTSGIFKAEDHHLSLVICPHHREEYGLRWRSGKVRCCVPNQVAGHKSSTTRGDRGMNSGESSSVFVATGELHPVGTRELSLTFFKPRVSSIVVSAKV